MLPSGSLNQATLSPVGAVQIPSLSCWKKLNLSNWTPFSCRPATTFSMPETFDNPGFGAEIPPQNQANEETQEWREKIGQLLFLFTDEVANKSGSIHAHKSDKCAKVQQIRS